MKSYISITCAETSTRERYEIFVLSPFFPEKPRRNLQLCGTENLEKNIIMHGLKDVKLHIAGMRPCN